MSTSGRKHKPANKNSRNRCYLTLSRLFSSVRTWSCTAAFTFHKAVANRFDGRW